MITKTYICHLRGKVSQALIKKMRLGANLSDGFLKPNKITLVKNCIEESIIKIRSKILVERESQKGIIIGHKGVALKKIGTKARLDLEKFFGKKVF